MTSPSEPEAVTFKVATEIGCAYTPFPFTGKTNRFDHANDYFKLVLAPLIVKQAQEKFMRELRNRGLV